MVSIDLQGQEKREKGTAYPEIFLPGMVQGTDHRGHVTDGDGFGVVSCGDNDEIV